MLEYQLDDAETLLQKNCNAATSSLEQVEDDLSFLRDQLTTVEVSILLHGQQARCPARLVTKSVNFTEFGRFHHTVSTVVVCVR